MSAPLQGRPIAGALLTFDRRYRNGSHYRRGRTLCPDCRQRYTTLASCPDCQRAYYRDHPAPVLTAEQLTVQRRAERLDKESS